MLNAIYILCVLFEETGTHAALPVGETRGRRYLGPQRRSHPLLSGDRLT
jgi:hypothetical protein